MEHVTAFLGGAGADSFNHPAVVDRLLQLVPASQMADGRRVHVAYLGTATYDAADSQEKQTGELARRGCVVRPIHVSDPATRHLDEDDAVFLREQADVVVVSGGNTLYAVQRWELLGIDSILKSLAENSGRGTHRRVVLAGGSAGAICWFTAGHSASADPTWFRAAKLKEAAEAANSATATKPVEPAEKGTWSYIRVHGLDILPGLLCPHFDVAPSNHTVRREEDFPAMVQRHPTERGLGLDHWAVLILPGDGSYEVFAVPEHTRQMGEGAAASDDTTPGLFVLDVGADGRVDRRRAAPTGRVGDVLRPPTGPVTADPLEAECAKANPAC